MKKSKIKIMELKEFLAIFKKYFLFISIFALIGSIVALIFASKSSSGFRLDQLFYIAPPAVSQNTPYNYEGYYAQEKARNFTDTAVAILESPQFLAEVVTSPDAISVRKVAPQVIKLTATAGDQQKSKDLIEKTASNFNQKIAQLSDPEQALEIKAVGQASIPAFTSPSKKVIALFGLLVGATFAIFVVGLKTYFKL